MPGREVGGVTESQGIPDWPVFSSGFREPTGRWGSSVPWTSRPLRFEEEACGCLKTGSLFPAEPGCAFCGLTAELSLAREERASLDGRPAVALEPCIPAEPERAAFSRSTTASWCEELVETRSILVRRVVASLRLLLLEMSVERVTVPAVP